MNVSPGLLDGTLVKAGVTCRKPHTVALIFTVSGMTGAQAMAKIQHIAQQIL